jgi:hypothetical protein
MIWTNLFVAAVTAGLAGAKHLALLAWEWWQVLIPAATLVVVWVLIWSGAVVRWAYFRVTGRRPHKIRED